MRCSHCGEELSYCSGCGESFTIGSDIICFYDKPTHHRHQCKRCYVDSVVFDKVMPG